MIGNAVRSTVRVTTGLLALGLALVAAPGVSLAGGDWNDAGIAWRSYDDGIAEAKKQNKPICLIFYTDWCPHCTNYSKVFHDPKVVEQSKKFVMIRLNKDENKEVSGRYAPDGQYIPRTFFLSSDGKLDDSVHAPRDKYKYFYSESDPASVLGGMDAALKKHGGAKS
jgi:thiol-disulfide isomerase/thioredoxin